MIFAKTVLTPKNTSQNTPLKTQWKLVSGLIYKFELYYPPGSSGLVGVALHDASVRLYPYGENEWFIGDNVTVSFEDEAFFVSPSGILDILSYNLDDTYDHSIQIRLGVVSDPVIIKSRLGAGGFDTLSGSLAELIKVLAEQNAAKSKYSVPVIEAVK